MATAKRLPSGSYRVRVYSHTDGNGRKVYESFTAATKKEAELKAAAFAASKDRVNSSDLTVKEAISGYINLKEKVLSPSTIRSYITASKRFTPIDNLKIKRLDNQTIQEFINQLASEVSPKSVHNIYALLTATINLYSPGCYYNITLPKIPDRIVKAPSDDDVDKILDKATGEMKKAIFLATLGVRRGEICAVEYEDIENNLLHIHRDLIRGKNGWELKEIPKTSESERYVLLPDNFRDILKYGTGKIVDRSPNTVTMSFHQLALSCGLSLHLHELRHYFASIAHAMGIPDQYIMAMGGWKSDFVMKKVYRNSIDDIEKKYREEYAKKISRKI